MTCRLISILDILGKVRGIAKKGENVKGDGLEIEWRIGADYDKQNSFTSQHEDGGEVIGWYFQEREDDLPQWLKDHPSCYIRVRQPVLDFINTVKSAPKDTTFVDWQRPYSTCEDGHECSFVNITDEDKWYITLARLNDPKMGRHYGGPMMPTPPVCYFKQL